MKTVNLFYKKVSEHCIGFNYLRVTMNKNFLLN